MNEWMCALIALWGVANEQEWLDLVARNQLSMRISQKECKKQLPMPFSSIVCFSPSKNSHITIKDTPRRLPQNATPFYTMQSPVNGLCNLIVWLIMHILSGQHFMHFKWALSAMTAQNKQWPSCGWDSNVFKYRHLWRKNFDRPITYSRKTIWQFN